MTEAQALVSLGIGVATLVGLVAGWVRWARPRIERAKAEATAIRDSIIGRDAIHDSITGREIAPALPGVGVRLDAQERHLGVLAEAVATLAQSHAQLEDHEARIKRLEDASAERIISRAEATASWRAIEEAVKAQPDQTVEDDAE